MDQRHTFDNYAALLSILSTLQQEEKMVSMLVDHDGLTRIQGHITSIVNSEDPKQASIHLGNHRPVLLSQVIGVNGIFHADYSEC